MRSSPKKFHNNIRCLYRVLSLCADFNGRDAANFKAFIYLCNCPPQFFDRNSALRGASDPWKLLWGENVEVDVNIGIGDTLRGTGIESGEPGTLAQIFRSNESDSL